MGRLARLAALLLATIVALGAVMATSSVAIEPDERLPDPALEARARALSAELRCLVCQNQSIDDSNAELAKDLRVLVRDRIAAGYSDREVLDFVVARYGDFVLLRPPFKVSTLLLWLAPFLVLIAAIAFATFSWRRAKLAYSHRTPANALTAEERAKLDELLNR